MTRALPVVTTAADDAELVRLVAAGDRDALRTLMRRHNQRLYRTARAILRDDGEAEDAVQEAYLLAYRSIGSFRGDARLSTWLVRIVVNEALGRRRKRERTPSSLTSIISAISPAEKPSSSDSTNTTRFSALIRNSAVHTRASASRCSTVSSGPGGERERTTVAASNLSIIDR